MVRYNLHIRSSTATTKYDARKFTVDQPQSVKVKSLARTIKKRTLSSIGSRASYSLGSRA